MKTLKIKLSDHEILLNFGNKGAAAIVSDLKDGCPFCDQSDCYNGCDESMGDDGLGAVETEDELDNRRRWNFGMNAIESLVLAHACAGINVCGEKYIKGIEQAIEGLSNDL